MIVPPFSILPSARVEHRATHKNNLAGSVSQKRVRQTSGRAGSKEGSVAQFEIVAEVL